MARLLFSLLCLAWASGMPLGGNRGRGGGMVPAQQSLASRDIAFASHGALVPLGSPSILRWPQVGSGGRNRQNVEAGRTVSDLSMQASAQGSAITGLGGRMRRGEEGGRAQGACWCPACGVSSVLASVMMMGAESEVERGVEEKRPGDAADIPGTGTAGQGEVGDEDGEPTGVSAVMISALRGYKKYLSPLLPPGCRFLPTCSVYAVEAIQKEGPAKGLVLTAWRLLRCNPLHWGRGGQGYDPPQWPPVAYWYHNP